MSSERTNFRVAVFIVLIKDDKILLQRRFNTGWEDGNYTFVSGHVEENESILEAGAREALEEAGIIIKLEDLKVIHVMHNKTDTQYINFLLQPNVWEGEPANKEPERCDDLSWFPIDNLPENTLTFLKHFVNDFYKNGVLFSEFGIDNN